MKNFNRKIALIVLIFLFLFIFAVGLVLAAEGLPNPLGEDNIDPRVIIGNVIKAALGVVGSLALAVFIFGGFTWVIAAGNDEKIKKGKDMIMWAALGLIVIFLSYALVSFVLGAIGATGGRGDNPTRTPDVNPTRTPDVNPTRQ